MNKKLRLGEVLIKNNLATEEQIAEALKVQKTVKKKIGEILVEMGYISENTLGEVLAKEYSMPFLDLSKNGIVDDKAIKSIPFQLIEKYKIFPLRIENGNLVIAVSDPLDISAIEETGSLSGYSIKPVIATTKQIEQCIAKYSDTIQNIDDALKQVIDTKKEDAEVRTMDMSLKELELVSRAAPIIKIVDSIVTDAISQGASDIHFEPRDKDMCVRFRIDGILYEKMKIPSTLQQQIISRIKIIAGMDIAERRRPQDGKISINKGGYDFDVRVSTLPVLHGEKVVLRLLDKKSILIPLDSLGVDDSELKLIDRLIHKPYGIILVTGPTGAGKTTTLYSILNTLNDPSRNIVSVEDPIEYELSRVNQTAINVRAGYTFATAIRHMLRQDPDIIMVGEIRDLETVEVAIQAALTGHLVLSTLHTNNAPGAITRLLDMNAEPFLISSAIIGVIAQRLVRKLCPYCRQEYECAISEELKKDIHDPAGFEKGKITLAKPVGCEKCNNMGHSKRTGIFEIFVMTDELRKLVLKRTNEAELTELAISQGMRTLRTTGFKKAREKITSLEEVMRVTFVDKD